ncbi:HNH endonuclease [Arsenicicoccus piscis]|uniref:HNH nuclease domain-containing protein n=1 Tax=Arsenicicoccus piscis TaxID=673954 RepID=A0ABQ6HSW9_9MICO|nr:HNH endonuclease signature motif containing protein [Arsenicicoccus piscis]MCH8626684.1 HNH endonuclease [Arsenicicoccus piscis]GMA21350.1 hypothetical protein GCM10025862_33710 [Arsenicicoccus piscis]
MGSPTPWLVSNNVNLFDAESALRDHPYVLWSQSPGIQVGDLVYLYATKPVGSVTHVLTVIERDIMDPTGDPSIEYWHDRAALARREARLWMRIRLERMLTQSEREGLSLAELRVAKHSDGVGDNFQGRRKITGGIRELVDRVLGPRPSLIDDDARAEHAPADPVEVATLAARLIAGDYTVQDTYATAKTRGSAQRAFADAVKTNYERRCAVTGITSHDFLVASHIVPWSTDETTRLDPANGVCLSTLIDRAFDTGRLHLTPDATVEINHSRLTEDPALAEMLTPFDGQPLRKPTKAAPARAHLERRYAADTKSPS